MTLTAVSQPGHRLAQRFGRPLLGAIALVSIVVNLLMLTGPIFMLQIYDRVLGSQSGATLLALIGLVGFLYLVMGFLDYGRALIAARMGAQFHQSLDDSLGHEALRAISTNPQNASVTRVQGDLALLQQFTATPIFLALFDLPWVPLFLLVITLLHPWLGAFALISVVILTVLTWGNMLVARGRGAAAQESAYASERLAAQLRHDSDGLGGPARALVAFGTLGRLRREAVRASLHVGAAIAAFGASARALRLFLQSAVLALGALLVLHGEVTPGVMIAASIILGRALAPVDQVIGQWAVISQARGAYARVSQFQVGRQAQAGLRTRLPAPKGHLVLRNLHVASPDNGAVVLENISFELQPGQSLGVIGNSGSGKSSLARALAGVWPLHGGEIRLGHAPLDQYDTQALAQYLGYLPQRVALLEGRLRDAIAGHDPAAHDQDVIAAAQMAGAHEMILGWPKGYDTVIGSGGAPLSGGQLQRIALARAVYGNPVMVIMDEPNSNLDNSGVLALNATIRALKARGSCVMVMAHRPAAIAECDLLMLLEAGRLAAFGPRDEVLRSVARNSAELIRNHFETTPSQKSGISSVGETAPASPKQVSSATKDRTQSAGAAIDNSGNDGAKAAAGKSSAPSADPDAPMPPGAGDDLTASDMRPADARPPDPAGNVRPVHPVEATAIRLRRPGK